MSFIETRLDDGVAYGFTAIPAYRTGIVDMDSGKEARNIKRTRAKRRFTAAYRNFSKANFALLLAAFHASKGSGYSFRMRDWTDFEATLEPLGNTPGANLTPVQLIKTYTLGAASTVRTINKPNLADFTLFQAGVPKAGTLDTTTGLFTPTTNWTAAVALTWTGTFDVAVRIDADELPSSYDRVNGISTTCELVEDLL